jgi:hypothetical protein
VINFPDTPSVGTIFQSGGSQWRWTGVKWTPSTPASPVDALALNGMQINGGMDISQELGTTGRSTAGYVVDAWRVDNTGTMAFSSAPVATIAPGFSNHLYVLISTAQTSLGASDYLAVGGSIEGYRIARLAWGTVNVQPLTLAFWTAHHRTGTYTGSVRNSALNRSCAFSYTQNAADIWEYKTVTIPGDTAGTWLITNGVGISLYFSMACGTTFTAPAIGVWYATNYLAGPGQVNGIAATSDFFRITGIILLPGTAAPTAANSPNVMRPYDQELRLCKRYFYNGVVPLRGVVSSTGAPGRMAARHPVTMRAAPTLTNTSLAVFDGGATTSIGQANVGATYNTVDTVELDTTSSLNGTLTAGRACVVYQGSGNMNVDARL